MHKTYVEDFIHPSTNVYFETLPISKHFRGTKFSIKGFIIMIGKKSLRKIILKHFHSYCLDTNFYIDRVFVIYLFIH